MKKKVEEIYRKRIEQEKNSLKTRVKELTAKENVMRSAIKSDYRSIDLKNRFLMNIMNSLGNLSIIEGAYKTNEMTCLFSKMLQYNFGTRGSFVSLEKELENVKSYLRIQQMCSLNKFDYQLKCNCSLKNKFVPYFSIYIFVENSILHGFDKIDYKGKLEILIFEDEKDYFIQIKDNGVGMISKKFKAFFKKDVDSSDANDYELSIQSFRKRIVSLFGKNYDIELQSKHEKGFQVLIRIPLAIEGIKVNG